MLMDDGAEQGRHNHRFLRPPLLPRLNSSHWWRWCSRVSGYVSSGTNFMNQHETLMLQLLHGGNLHSEARYPYSTDGVSWFECCFPHTGKCTRYRPGDFNVRKVRYTSGSQTPTGPDLQPHPHFVVAIKLAVPWICTPQGIALITDDSAYICLWHRRK
ncbi:hypothetical protein BDV06DRAFT_70819 [Aspergillus oleicola]